MATAINVDLASYRENYPEHRCYVRDTWGAGWVFVPYLYCNRLTMVAAPGIDSAELIYHYGRIAQHDASEYEVFYPQNIVGQFVKVEVDQTDANGVAINPLVWVGRIVEEMRPSHGNEEPLAADRVAHGDQLFLAQGLLYELSRVFVTSSVVQKGAQQITIRRGIGFNMGADAGHETDDGFRENRSLEAVGTDDTFVFCESPDDYANVRTWDASEAVRYLLAYFPPRNFAGDPAIPFRLDTGVSLDSDVISWSEPKLPTHGASVKALLDELMDRRRLMSYWVRYDATQNVMWIVPFTFTTTSLEVDTSVIVPANAHLRTWDTESGLRLVEVVRTRSMMHQYDQVILRGGRRGAVFSVSYTDGTLKAGWDTAEQDEYNDGASGEGDYPNNNDERRIYNRLARQAERLARVYRAFVLPTDWDGKAGDGEGGTKKFVCPRLDEDGEPMEEGLPLWLPGLRLQDRLPLLRDGDYSGTNILSPSGIPVVTPDKMRSEYMEPQVYVPMFFDTGKWARLNDLCESDPLIRLSRGAGRWQVRPRSLDSGLGLSLEVFGAEQHMLALNEFVEADSSDEPAEVDWQQFIATVYMLTDEPVEGRYPENLLDASPGDPTRAARVLEIELRERVHLDYVVPGTVVGALVGDLKRSTSGGFVRDDRPRLKRLARLAYEWYSRERHALRVTIARLVGVTTDNTSAAADTVRLGDLITELGAGWTLQTVNTPITSIQLDFLSGVTLVQTDFAELDVEAQR